MMMGRRSGDQDRLFYDVSLDQLVPADHSARRIDAVLDLSWRYGKLALMRGKGGRPTRSPVSTGGHLLNFAAKLSNNLGPLHN